MLQRRSLFGLAYAYESSGDFDLAEELYQQIVDLGEETPFAEVAARGLECSTNPQFAALFQKFRDFEGDPESAPGLRLPQRPDISFPDLSAQPDAGGGDFGADESSVEVLDESGLEDVATENLETSLPTETADDSGE